jgi:hypothetical protein
MRKIYAIGVGGSGAKCLESTVFLHALGIFGDSRLGVLLVDADAANGNSQRTQINLKNTLECYRLFKPGSELKSEFMSGKFEDYGIWNPLGDVIHSSNLSKIFNQQSLSTTSVPLAKLFDALYSPDEQEADLAVGFRGRPPIGSAVMSRLELESLPTALSDNWQRLFNNVQTDRANGDEVSIHLFGSIFGGTGASGAPTLATLISNQLRNSSLRGGVHLNASLLLPYFSFEKPDDGDQKIFAETRFFALNTQAALQYLTEHSSGVFDSVYLIGNQEKQNYSAYTGGTNQQNDAHFVELYAALAINHGFEQPIGQTQAAYISRTSQERLVWQDLPNSKNVKRLLAKGVRFAYSWHYNFALELVSAQKLGAKKFAKGAPWFRFFFSLKQEEEGGLPSLSEEAQKKRAEILEKWARSFLIWAQQVASSHRQGEQLFRLKAFDLKIEDRSYGEDLSELIIDGAKSPKEKARDRLDTVKNQLADQGKKGKGVIGLAHELFRLL